ncbi:hypothetical protein OAJ18_01555 [Pelagibacteraceae bacterium]|nr:hypothetical protein [Pelagibacteraceae bacterium]
MHVYPDSNKFIENKVYNFILLLSRNKVFYTKFDLSDTFQNRIILIFLHISFIFIKIKREKKILHFKEFYQKVFDLIFKNLDLNMREIGYGDVAINKNMKFLVKTFYNILLKSENYNKINNENKRKFLFKYLTLNNRDKSIINQDLIRYFDEYHSFCLDLSSEKVLKGDLNFNYK